MVTLASIIPSFDPGNCYTVLDLNDVYFHVAIHQSHRRFLRFLINDIFCQFTVQPFSLSTVLWVFVKCMEVIAAFLRKAGV